MFLYVHYFLFNMLLSEEIFLFNKMCYDVSNKKIMREEGRRMPRYIFKECINI